MFMFTNKVAILKHIKYKEYIWHFETRSFSGLYFIIMMIKYGFEKFLHYSFECIVFDLHIFQRIKKQTKMSCFFIVFDQNNKYIKNKYFESILETSKDSGQAFQLIFCVQVINHLCKKIFSKMAWAIYCLP